MTWKISCYEDYEYARDNSAEMPHVEFDENVTSEKIARWSFRYAIERGRAAREADAVSPPPDTGFIADEAKRIVSGDRNAAYGEPEDDFERIARFWTAYLQNMGLNITLTAANVSPMMRLLKEARLCRNPTHLDSHIDIVGYVLTGARVNGVKKPD